MATIEEEKGLPQGGTREKPAGHVPAAVAQGVQALRDAAISEDALDTVRKIANPLENMGMVNTPPVPTAAQGSPARAVTDTRAGQEAIARAREDFESGTAVHGRRTERVPGKPAEAAPSAAETAVARRPFTLADGSPLLDRDGNPVTVEGDQRDMSLTELYQTLSGYRQRSKEDIARDRKRERRQKIISAVGDGISALANLFATNRYAPDSFDPSATLSAKARERWARYKADREKERGDFVNGYLNAAALDWERGYKERAQDFAERKEANDWAVQEYKMELQANEDRRKNEEHELQMLILDGKVTEQDALARLRKIQADYGEANENARIALMEARKNAANRSNRGGGGGSREFRAWDKDSKVHYFRTKAAADAFAVQEGTAVSENTVTKRTNTGWGGSKTGTTTTESTGKPAAGKPENEGTKVVHW